MPTKTSKTSKTSGAFVKLTNVNAQPYVITKTQLREAFGVWLPYKMNLANIELKPRGSRKHNQTVTSVFTIGRANSNDYQKYLADIVTDNKTYIDIGCQRFEGVNARKIFRAVARVAKVTARKARAAAAGA